MSNENNDSRIMRAQLDAAHSKRMRRLFLSSATLCVGGALVALVLPAPHKYAGLAAHAVGFIGVASWILDEYRMKRQRSAEAGAADDAPSNDAPEKPDISVEAVNAAARARAGMPEDWVPYVWEWISGGLLLTGCRTRPEASGSGYRFLMDEDNKRVILSDAEINALRSA